MSTYRAEYHREYVKKNREKVKAKQAAWYRANREKVGQRRIKVAYNITREEYAAMYWCQDGRCAICKRPEAECGGRGKKLHIDHCHETDRVRGLLCTSCNTGIGQFQDNSDLMRRAIEYVDNK